MPLCASLLLSGAGTRTGLERVRHTSVTTPPAHSKGPRPVARQPRAAECCPQPGDPGLQPCETPSRGRSSAQTPTCRDRGSSNRCAFKSVSRLVSLSDTVMDSAIRREYAVINPKTDLGSQAGCGEEGSEATASRLGVMPLRPQAAVKSESWEVGV